MLTDIHIQHFRSYKDSSFDFENGVNIIVGPNASGKTNLLEAVLVICKGKSYRVKDTELIHFDKDWARIDANLSNGSTRTVKLNQTIKPNKLYKIDNKELRRLNVNHIIPTVLFEPDHLRLLTGSPDRRREYLDDLIEQITPGYSSLRRQYSRTLAQRNALLKRFSTSFNTQIFPWNVRLSEFAGRVVKERQSIVKKLNEYLEGVYKDLSKSNQIAEVIYQNKWSIDSYESNLLKELELNIETDLARGFTTLGPHREDLSVILNKRTVQEVASRGEVRTIILGLKITELEILKENFNSNPILLLDDVFSELDGKRRHTLTDRLGEYQTFITTTDADLVTKNFTQATNMISVLSN